MRLLAADGSWADTEHAEDEVMIAITRGELAVLSSSIRETLEALEDWEFDTRVGALPSEARAIRNQINIILQEHSRRD